MPFRRLPLALRPHSHPAACPHHQCPSGGTCDDVDPVTKQAIRVPCSCRIDEKCVPVESEFLGGQGGFYCRRLCGGQEPGGCATWDCMCSHVGWSYNKVETMKLIGMAGYQDQRQKQMCQNNACTGTFEAPTCAASPAAGARCADVVSGAELGCTCPQDTPACNVHTGYW